MDLPIKLIVAQSLNGVIGRDREIPWHLPTDLKFFRKMTEGHIVIMGRHTYESIGKPLPNRRNIVLTRNPDFHVAGIEGFADVDQVIPHIATTKQPDQEVYVIGGEAVYRHFLPMADIVYMTLVDAVVEGDAWFPRLTEAWDVTMIDQHVEKPEMLLRGDWFSHRMYKLERRILHVNP